MTFPAPAFLKDDPWFGPAPLSDKAKAVKVKLEPVKVETPIHEVLYQVATKNKTTSIQRDQPWLSGAGR
jgi:hypothetical protein